MTPDKISDIPMRNMSDTESRILCAAEKVFISKGFAAARTTTIAEMAGVTHAMLHYYFRTKENLFERVVAEKIDSVARTFIIPFDHYGKNIDECIREGMARHFDFVRRNPQFPKFMISEVIGNEKLMGMLKVKIMQTAGSVISQLQNKIDEESEKGRCRKVDAFGLMIDIISLNIFPVLIAPVLYSSNDGDTSSAVNEFFESRKQTNIDIIIHKLMI